MIKTFFFGRTRPLLAARTPRVTGSARRPTRHRGQKLRRMVAGAILQIHRRPRRRGGWLRGRSAVGQLPTCWPSVTAKGQEGFGTPHGYAADYLSRGAGPSDTRAVARRGRLVVYPDATQQRARGLIADSALRLRHLHLQLDGANFRVSALTRHRTAHAQSACAPPSLRLVGPGRRSDCNGHGRTSPARSRQHLRSPELSCALLLCCTGSARPPG